MMQKTSKIIETLENGYSFESSQRELLRSYDTLYRWHLLGTGQTKIIYYNLPDVTGNIDKKLNFIEYVPILILPAYYK